jgi:hypothetical protein
MRAECWYEVGWSPNCRTALPAPHYLTSVPQRKQTPLLFSHSCVTSAPIARPASCDGSSLIPLCKWESDPQKKYIIFLKLVLEQSPHTSHTRSLTWNCQWNPTALCPCVRNARLTALWASGTSADWVSLFVSTCQGRHSWWTYIPRL